MKKRASQTDVAREAGVSVTTVNFVLNGRENTRITSETAERVRIAAEKLGYSTDSIGRMLRTGQSRSLAFVSDGVTVTRYASAMIRGVLDAAEKHGYTVLMAEIGDHLERLDGTVASLLDRRVDGLIFGLMSARKIDLPPLPAGTRAILVNGVANGLPSILPAEYEAGRAAINFLLHAGHRRIAFIGRSERAYDLYRSATIPTRFAGMDDTMKAAGIAFVAEFMGDEWEPELGYRGALQLLNEGTPFTALLAANDRVAFGVYRAFQEYGLTVPDDVAVLSFDDEQLATYVYPPLTTMRLPYREMGYLSVELLLSKAFAQPGEKLLVPMPLIERESVSTAKP